MNRKSVPGEVRVERDSMGEIMVPADAYYGASTQRAVENFPISDLRMPSEFIAALAAVKYCAAEANCQLGLLSAEQAAAIKKALGEVLQGRFDSSFVVDVFQTGSGTSTNMNINEVVARRARELMGGSPDDRSLVHPNDHVNSGQSSNDVIPTALHLSAYRLIDSQLLPAVELLARALKAKSKEFRKVVKTGRTHLQDATPVTLGQEFGGYAAQLTEAASHLRQTSKRLTRVALGGTAVGTGINAHPQFASTVCKLLSKELGFPVREAKNHFRAQSTIDDVVATSGALKLLAVSLKKIADDIRWMGSGPRAGFGELALPEVQPGSSIMPGKVNPVIAESLRMVCVQVMGYDTTITIAGQGDNFELNVMLPVVAYDLLQSIRILASSCRNFSQQCVVGLTATQAGPLAVESGLALATALVPEIGYDEAARLAKVAATTGDTILEVAKRETKIPEKKLRRLLDPLKLTRRGSSGAGSAGG